MIGYINNYYYFKALNKHVYALTIIEFDLIWFEKKKNWYIPSYTYCYNILFTKYCAFIIIQVSEHKFQSIAHNN